MGLMAPATGSVDPHYRDMDAATPKAPQTCQLGTGLRRSLRHLDAGKPFSIEGLSVTHAVVNGHALSFCWSNPHDPIQGRMRHGEFYEAEELAVLARYFTPGGTLIDVGANVGNHSLYFARMLSAARIVPIEPNPQVLPLLLANIVLNGLRDRFDLRFLGKGLSDKPAGGFAMQERSHNIGGARMLAGKGEIEVLPGDAVAADCAPSMIKIDVEGMEMQVLAGFEATLRLHKPVLFVEVDRRNDTAFREWLAGSGYGVAETFSRYRANTNYLLQAGA